jgi:hypothetical protein
VNTICEDYEKHLADDLALYFLHDTTLELYTFWIAISKKTLSAHFHITPISFEYDTDFYYTWGIPAVKQALPVPERRTLKWLDDRVLKQMELD